MKILLVLVFVLTSIEDGETEDRIKPHKTQEEKSIPSIPLKRGIHKESSSIPRSEYRRDTVALIDEDFESGMPADWTVIDGNNDGHTWTTGTYYLLYYHPPNYGTTYAYYADNDAGSGAPAGTEYLISPAVSCAGVTAMSLSYGWGHNQMTLYAYGTSQIRLHNGTAWGSWNTLATFAYTTNGGDNFNLNTYLPAESVQVQFTYEDPYGEWGMAFGIDNVLLEAEMPSFYVWDFETGWQGWTHTNGMPFPAGWGVGPSGTHPGQTPPIAGDSCMWIDSDAGGSGFWIQDSALSPVCTPNSGMDWLKYGFCNYGGSGSYINELHVGIKHSTGGVWTAMELAFYPTGVTSGPAWDSVDVSAYTSADSLQVYLYFDDLNTWGYWACFDNVAIDATPCIPDHDVGCLAVVSPPEGRVDPYEYDVIGWVCNLGTNDETFDAVANVYDTSGMAMVFNQTVNLTLAAGADSNINFGQVTFWQEVYYLTEIFTTLQLDTNSSNDTSHVISWSTFNGTVVFEMDVEAICNDNQLLGIEFDGFRFYISGGNNASDPNKIYVVDIYGNLLWTLDQPAHSTGWGWRDLTWDGTYVGGDRIDTLYASVDNNVDKFSIDLSNGSLIYHGFFPGPQSPNRALAYFPDSNWFYTANFSSDCFKFEKSGVIIQSVPNTYVMYGAAYDEGDAMWPWQTPIESIWWHSQDDPGTGFACQISRMDPHTMEFFDMPFGYTLPSALTDAIAGGLCYELGAFPPLYALLQGTPHDYIVGITVASYGINEEADFETRATLGFTPTTSTITRGSLKIFYTTSEDGFVSLKVYDIAGRLVRKLVEKVEPAGNKSVHWDGTDQYQQNLASGVYLLHLETAEKTDIRKIVLVK